MPDIKNFDGQQIVEPGSYSTILGKVPAPPVTANYGNVVLIDTGIGKTYGYGSGVVGQLQTGRNSIYKFSTPLDAQNAIRGGVIWALIDYLFTPSNNGKGAQAIYIVRGATTVCASAAMNFATNKGKISIFAKNEGKGGNGSVTSNIVTKGYGMRLKSGVYSQTKFVIEFYEGQFRGLDADGIPYDGISESTIVQNTIVARSSEFSNVAEFLAWATSSVAFNNYFVIDVANTTTSAVTITSGALATFPSTIAFAGGTEVYNSTRVDEILDAIPDLDNAMFLALDYGPVDEGTASPGVSSQELQDGINKGALSTENSKILAYTIQTATDKRKTIYIGGNYASSGLVNGTDGSIDFSLYYNSPNVVVVHDKIKVPALPNTLGVGYKFLDTVFSAAAVCGRFAGVEPQVNGTFKDIRMIGVYEELKKSQREQALLNGVLHFRNVETLGWVINQQVNSMQRNNNVVYNDGTSPEISVMRIAYQLNREGRLGLLQYVGGNIGTVTQAEVVDFVQRYLQARCVDTNAGIDNLIITYNSVTAKLINAAWDIKYCFVPNGPINQLFSTGFMLDPKIALQ